MISVLKTGDGLVKAYIEWEVVNENGQFDNAGAYIYIQNCWIHPFGRWNGALQKLAKLIDEHPYAHATRFVYWGIARDDRGLKILENEERPYTTKRRSRIFPRQYILQKLRKEIEDDKEIVE